jgi:hypothetical protein
VSVAFTFTLNDTDTVFPAGTVTVHESGVDPETTRHAPVAGSGRQVAEPATSTVLEGAASWIVSVPVAVPALWAVKV